MISQISPRAEKELLSSYSWYEKQQKGLGNKFLNEFYSKAALIEKHPKRAISKRQGYHEKPMSIYPYLIVYRYDEHKKTIIISTVFHFKRNPKKKYR